MNDVVGQTRGTAPDGDRLAYLLAQRWVRYATICAFAKALAGLLMLAGALMWLSIAVALFIGGIGAISVFKAVFVDERELKFGLRRRRQQRATSASSPSPRTW